MRGVLIYIVLVGSLISYVWADVPSGKYERGTIVAVAHEQSNASPDGGNSYEVSVQVRNVVYVTRYSPPYRTRSIEYAAGIDLLVLVGKDTLSVPSKLSGTVQLPILRTETLPEEPTIQWSKAPSQYFAMKMQNLSETLDLNDEQQAKIKPIAEQETGEASQALYNPVVSRKDKLKRWEQIVRASDAKMRHYLSQTQWEKLVTMRKQQKRELKQLVAEGESKRK